MADRGDSSKWLAAVMMAYLWFAGHLCCICRGEEAQAQEGWPFSVLQLEREELTWRDGKKPRDAQVDSFLGIPKLIHRSHKHKASQLRVEPRLWANLGSCARLNPEHETRYYDDGQVVAALQDFAAGANSRQVNMSLKRLSVRPLSSAFVLRSDWFRLAAVYQSGGWWLDGDVRCIDPIDEVLNTPSVVKVVTAALRTPARACVFAWEGEVSQPTSAPLNWAFGCPQRHPFLRHVMEELATRVLGVEAKEQRDLFAAPVQTQQGIRYVDVLRTTGPGMVGEALTSYAGRDLRKIREKFGERSDDQSTWDVVSVVRPKGDTAGWGTVVLLPYCFFRSRGCPHLLPRFQDRPIFHHEFDTSWRPSFWHNFFDGEKEL